MATKKSLSKVLEKYTGPLTFAMFVRAARTQLDLSQNEMAKKLGMAPGTLCDIEEGRQYVTPTLALKIAKKVGFSKKLALQASLRLGHSRN